MLRLGLALVVCLAPLASAQGPVGPLLAFQVEGLPAGPIIPEAEGAAVEAVITVRCDAVLGALPTDPQVTVALSFTTTEGIVVSGPHLVAVDPAQCIPPAADTTLRQVLQVTVPRTAPGLQSMEVEGLATLRSSAPTATDGTQVATTFAVVADYYSHHQVKLSSKLQPCKPGGHAVYEVEVTNFGNARTQYGFEAVGQPGGQWTIDLPAPFLLDRPTGANGTSATVPMRVSCTGMNSEGAFSIVVTPMAADDPSKEGEPMTVNLLARSRGAIPIPGPGPFVPLALFAVAVALARRRP